MVDDSQKIYLCGQCGGNWFGLRIESSMPHWVTCPHCGHTFQSY